MWWMLPILVIGVLLVHLCKMLRLYFVLMEHRIGFGRFVLMYFRTTLVNLIVPFKLGEIYRIYCVSKETKVWQVGILTVLADRFFDIVALVIVLLPFDLVVHGGLTTVTFVLLTGILVLSVIYLIIMPSYQYLNQYIIQYKSSKRALMALKALDIVKQWYLFTNNLVTGRFALITAASFAGWIMEVAVLKFFSVYLNIAFAAGDFGAYIEAIFTLGDNALLQTYTTYSVVIMLVAVIAGYAVKAVRQIGKSR